MSNIDNLFKDFRKFYQSRYPQKMSAFDDIISKQGNEVPEFLEKYKNYINPQIIEEREMHATTMDVFSRLMMDRQIYFGHEVTPETCNIVIAQLLYLKSVSSEPIVMYLNSPGGSVVDGFGLIDTMGMLITDKSVTIPLTVASSALALFVILMYICVPFGAMFKTWGYDFHLTTKWFQQVFTRYKGFKTFKDSFVLSLISAPITALLSMIISYLVVKRKFKAKGFIEAVSMLAMAVPGTVLGIGYIRGFSGGIFGTGFLQGLYGTGTILVIVFIVRSLPTGTRSGISALRQIDKSIEESAYDMGADSFKVFMTVTLPLIKDSFLSGFITSFVRSITAISAIILLVTPSFLLITVQINEFAEKGAYGIACAFASILILITYSSVLIMNILMKYFGTSRRVNIDKE